MILIDALHINNGGGKNLLEYLINSLKELKTNEKYIFIIDERLETEQLIDFQFVYIAKPNFRSRYCVYKKIFDKFLISKVFCFNNLPPPFKINSCPVYIYFHNVLLLESKNYSKFFDNIFFKFKNYFLNLFNNSEYTWIVQTGLVAKKLQKKIKINQNKIIIIPFYNLNKSIVNSSFRNNNFLYVADGSQHKNHDFLFLVFQELANKFQIYPELLLTIDQNKFPEIINRITELNKDGLKIRNLGFVNKNDLIHIYNQVEFCIYPSKCESFGLPLIEAVLYNCKVLAIEMDYVKQVIVPSHTFPDNNVSFLARLIHAIFIKEIIVPESKVIIENQINKLIKLLQYV